MWLVFNNLNFVFDYIFDNDFFFLSEGIYVIMLLTKYIMLYVTLWDITFSHNMLGSDVNDKTRQLGCKYSTQLNIWPKSQQFRWLKDDETFDIPKSWFELVIMETFVLFIVVFISFYNVLEWIQTQYYQVIRLNNTSSVINHNQYNAWL